MKDALKRFHSGRAIFFLMLFFCSVLAAAVLKIAAPVVLPFTIALLLAIAMYPMVKWLKNHKIPGFVSILLVVIIIAVVLYAFGMVIYTSGVSILSQYENYEDRFTRIYEEIANIFKLPLDEDLSFWQNLWGQIGVRAWITSFAGAAIKITANFVSTAFLVMLFIVFILLEAGIFKEKLKTIFINRSDNIGRIGNDFITQVTRYLTAKFFISLATGLLIALGLWLIGVEFAVVWGVIAFAANFIPVLGSIFAGLIISLFALIQFWPAPIPIILVVALVLAVNMIIGNILDPRIVGVQVGISPLVVLVSLGLWNYIWGFAGMILAVPMTVVIKIVCENIPILEPVAIILGSRRAVKAKKIRAKKTEK